MNNNDLIVVKKEMVTASDKLLLHLDRAGNKLVLLEKTENSRLNDYHSIRADFDSSDYVMYEKKKEFPCIFGGETTPTPRGIFQIERKSKDAYISGYYKKKGSVKFFGYLVIFEDYFIHSHLYDADVEETQMRNGEASPLSKGDESTSGCIRVSREDLDWLLEKVEVGTMVML